MATRIRDRVVRRPSLPLTEVDEAHLRLLRSSPTHRHALDELVGRLSAGAESELGKDLTESALLHMVFEAGLDAIHARAQEAGYAELARSRSAGDQVEARAIARRRRPSWADEQ